jgi:hypothetical protein
MMEAVHSILSLRSAHYQYSDNSQDGKHEAAV